MIMKFKRLLLIIVLSFLFLSSFSIYAYKKEKEIREIKYEEEKPFDFELHSNSYLLMRLSDLTVLNSHNINEKIFPASLTKVMTLNTVLRLEEELSNTSSVSKDQINNLIELNASLAYLRADHEYSIEDLLYALILPSGADGALALENYFSNKKIDLINELNKTAKILKLKNSNFTNTTGLHDENNYTCVKDLLTLVLDTFKYEKAREILESLSITLDDGLSLNSTLSYIDNRGAKILGGKTGYTPQAGECLIMIFKYDNRSYLWISAAAMGKISNGEFFHYEDAQRVLEEIING